MEITGPPGIAKAQPLALDDGRRGTLVDDLRSN